MTVNVFNVLFLTAHLYPRSARGEMAELLVYFFSLLKVAVPGCSGRCAPFRASWWVM